MGGHLNLDGGTLNLNKGTRPPYKLSTAVQYLTDSFSCPIVYHPKKLYQ